MARRSSGGRSARPALLRRSAPAPVRQAAPPPPAQSGTSGGALIGSAIAEGMGLAAGIEIASRIFGPRTIKHETVVVAAPTPTTVPTANCSMGGSDACNVNSKAFPPAAVSPANTIGGSDACNIHSKAFQDCINNFGSDISKCQFYMDMLSDCKKNSSGMLISA